MADTVIYIRDAKTGALLPIKAKDNGEGTYNAGVLAILADQEEDIND